MHLESITDASERLRKKNEEKKKWITAIVKMFIASLVFQLTLFSLYWTTKESLAFIKATLHAFVISITCALFKVDWLVNFQRRGKLIGLLEF